MCIFVCYFARMYSYITSLPSLLFCIFVHVLFCFCVFSSISFIPFVSVACIYYYSSLSVFFLSFSVCKNLVYLLRAKDLVSVGIVFIERM